MKDASAPPLRPQAAPGPSGMRRRHSLVWLVAGFSGSASWLRSGSIRAQAPASREVRIIVHPNNAAASVERRFISQAFLKKTHLWPGGEPIRPVDLPFTSETRSRFSESIHGRSPAAVKSYWQQVIFSGRGVPPPELDSEEAVVRHVLRTPGGIGYVSASVDLKGARVLPVR